MRSVLHRARASTRVQQQLTRVRKLRDRLIDPPLKQIEHARRRLVEEDVDVLLLGDSSTLCWSVKDQDRTLIPELLGRRVGNVVALNGPGFGAPIYDHALRILSTLDRRPKVVVATLALRTATASHITHHPIVGYHRSLAELETVTTARRRIRYVGRGGQRPLTDEQRASYEAYPVRTRWGGESTIGDFRRHLVGLGSPPWSPEIERLRFDYFHGEEISPDNPGLSTLTSFAERLEDYGVPAVTFWTRPPLQRGEMHFPGEFESFVREHLQLQEKALAAGSSSIGPMLDVDVDDDDFEDSQNANEHFSYTGRVKVADAIADAVRQAR